MVNKMDSIADFLKLKISWKTQTIKQADIRKCDKYCGVKDRVLFHLHVKHISNISTVRKMVNGPAGIQEEAAGDIAEVVPTITIKILFDF